MEQWTQEMSQMLQLLLRHPGSGMERWLVLGISFFIMVWALSKVGAATGIPNTGMGHSAVAAFVGILVMLCSMVAVQRYILPELTIAVRAPVILLTAGLLASVAVVVVLKCIAQKATVVAGALTWCSGLCAATAVILVVSTVFAGLRSGAKDVERTKSRTAEMQHFINQH